MICTLTARRLKPGAYDAFRAAWGGMDEEPPPEVRERWRRVYHVRDVTDENVIISFGLFDGTVDELREIQGRLSRDAQVDTMAPHVEEVLLDGAYEVIEELEV